jgi:hypothetical protein
VREAARIGTLRLATTPKDDGSAFILARDGGAQVLLRDSELRWLLTAGIPAVLTPLPSPAEHQAQRAAARKAGPALSTPGGDETTGLSTAPAEDVPQAAPAPPAAAARPEPGQGVGYTILPGTDDDDAPPSAGGTGGGASGTLPLEGIDVGPS